jgi:hypothetical protein
MKKLLVACAIVVMAATGCQTTSNDSSKPAAHKKPQKNPEVGMTMDQIVEMYGKTDNKQVTSEGEVWIYNLNPGEAFIPWNFGYRPKIRTIYFGQDGKVKSWSYSQ